MEEERRQVKERTIDGFAFRLGCASAKKKVRINGVDMISMTDLEEAVHKVIAEMKSVK